MKAGFVASCLAVVLSVLSLALPGCQTWPPWDDLPDVPAITNVPPLITNTPPVDPPQPGVPVPIKLTATGRETLPDAFVQKEKIFRDFGLSDVRYLSVTKDAFINDLGHNHTRQENGYIVADDFKATSGGREYIFKWDKFMSKVSANVIRENPMKRSDAQATFRVWWRCYDNGAVASGPDDSQPPEGECQNRPAFCQDSDVPNLPDKTDNLRKASPNQFIGKPGIRVRNADQATNLRYRLMSWFHNQGYMTGYPYPGSDKTGCVYIFWDVELPEDAERDVGWRVL